MRVTLLIHLTIDKDPLAVGLLWAGVRWCINEDRVTVVIDVYIHVLWGHGFVNMKWTCKYATCRTFDFNEPQWVRRCVDGFNKDLLLLLFDVCNPFTTSFILIFAHTGKQDIVWVIINIDPIICAGLKEICPWEVVDVQGHGSFCWTVKCKSILKQGLILQHTCSSSEHLLDFMYEVTSAIDIMLIVQARLHWLFLGSAGSLLKIICNDFIWYCVTQAH